MSEIKVQFSDIVTPEVCSLLIKQMIKYIIYDSEQIPYPYQTLEHIVTSIASREETGTDVEISYNWELYQARRFYEQISTLFYDLENTFKSIRDELRHSSCGVEEVMVVLGSSMFNAKSAFRICLPKMERGTHLYSNHHPPAVLLSQLLKGVSSCPPMEETGPTNVYILLKMSEGSCPQSSTWFLPKDNFRLSSRVNEVVFRLESGGTREEGSRQCPCPTPFAIYRDSQEEGGGPVKSPATLRPSQTGEDEEEEEEEREEEVSYCTVWYETRVLLKGFKAFKMNGAIVPYSYLLDNL